MRWEDEGIGEEKKNSWISFVLCGLYFLYILQIECFYASFNIFHHFLLYELSKMIVRMDESVVSIEHIHYVCTFIDDALMEYWTVFYEYFIMLGVCCDFEWFLYGVLKVRSAGCHVGGLRCHLTDII